MNYIKPFDSIRAVAVLLVIFTHWFPAGHFLNTYTSFFNGVDIFFTLSGFLITRILLENRVRAEKIGTAKISVIKNFFIRRCLRIFPAYYLLIFVLFVLGPATQTNIRNNFPYFITYTSNFYFFQLKSWDGMLSHLWSLAVEEQFYLLWPWLMLFVNRKALLVTIIFSFIVGFSTQIYLQNEPFGNILTITCFDGFSIGALLAWCVVHRQSLLTRNYNVICVLGFISFILQLARVFSSDNFSFIPSRTLTAFFTGWVICSIVLQEHKRLKLADVLLNAKPLVFLGKVSYGVYLYHLMFPYWFSSFFSKINAIFLPQKLSVLNFYLVRIENFSLLLLLSYFSWAALEEPILRLKKRFDYQQKEINNQTEVLSA